MTDERTHTKLQTQRSLRWLTDSYTTQDVSLVIRQQAIRVLRHHPGSSQIAREHRGRLTDFASPHRAIRGEGSVPQRTSCAWSGHDGRRRND